MPKGYLLPSGFYGYIDGEYILFPTEDEYYDLVKERGGIL